MRSSTGGWSAWFTRAMELQSGIVSRALVAARRHRDIFGRDTPLSAPQSPISNPQSTLLLRRRVVFPAEHVAFAPPGENQGRLEVLVDLVPEVADINVHDVRRVLVVLVVEVLPDHAPGHHLAPVEGQELEQGVLAGGEVDD